MVAQNATQVIKTTHKEWRPNEDDLRILSEKAEQLWPETLPFHAENRSRWVKAVEKVRGTAGGWVLDPGSSPRKY